MKKALKIIGIVLLALVVIAAGLIIWQWKYFGAVWDVITKNEEQLGQMRVENTEKVIESVNQHMDSEIRPMTEEEKAKIQSGELSQTEVMAQLVAEATGIELPGPEEIAANLAADENTSRPTGGSAVQEQEQTTPPPAVTEPAPPVNQNTSVSSSDQLVANCVSKLYALQSQYTGQLAGFVGRAKAYYNEQKAANGVAAAKSSAMSMVAGEVAAMEGACDAKVEAALSELTEGLRAIGADTAIVGELRSAYEKEKSNQRRAYINKYMK